MTSAQRAYNRDPSDIHIAILTQSESQSTGLSIITATVDSQAPELSNIATHVTAPFFVQQSSDTYKASNVTITMFINILIGVKANGWTLMGTNAFLNSAKQEVVKTFYFEKVSGRSNSSSSSSSGSVGVRQVAQSAGKGAQLVTTPVSSSNHNNNNNNNNNNNAGEVEDKTSAEAVEHRIASIMAAQSARKSFLQQQQQTSSSSSSSGRNNEGDVVATSPLGPILNITPRVKTTTPGARPAGGAASGGVGGGGGAGGGTEMQKKNAEYFRRMKAEQDLEKKKLEEQEAKLDEAEQRRLKEQRALQEAHDASKTAHFSRLGATFVNTQGVFASKRPPI